MPRSATTGLYETLTNSNFPAAPGVTIASSAHNAVIEDQESAINVTADQLQGIAWADIASASTVNIGAATSSNLRVTGTTSITAFDTVRSGITKTLRFAGVLTLTYNATSLILPGTANITTAANDVAEFVSLGSGNWLCTKYTRASGSTVKGELRAEWFGYVSDAIIFGDGAITSGDNTLTATGLFTTASVGKLIVVFGAGAAGADLVTTIASYTSAGSVELTAAAGTTVSGKTGGWGTDNASALAAIATAAIAAYGARVVYPAGDALTSATHDFPDAQYLALRGLGQGVTRLWSTSATADLIHVRATTSGTPVFNFSIDDITLRRLRSDVTAGAGLRLTHCNTFSIGQNVTALDHFTSYDFESAVIGVHMGDLQAGAFWGSVKTGSVGQLYRQKSGYPTCAEIRIPAVHARSSGNNRLDYGVRIRGADGLFFEGGYVGFCNEAAIALEPETTSTQLSGVSIDGVWADETTKYGVKVQTPTGYNAVFGDHSIKLTKCYNCDQAAVFWDCENAGTTENSLIEIDQAFHLGKHGVWITDATRLRVSIIAESIAEASAASGIYIDGTVSELYLYSDTSKVGSFTPDAAVYFHTTAIVGNNVSIAWRAIETTFDAVVGQSSGTVSVRSGECVSSRDNATYTANASGVLDSGLATRILCNGLTAPATGIGSWSVPAGLTGLVRQVTFTATVDVFDVNDLIIAGSFSATANDTLTVTCRGGNNYELARSAN